MALDGPELERLAHELLVALGFSEGETTRARVQAVVFYLELWVRLWRDPSPPPDALDRRRAMNDSGPRLQ